MEVSAHRPLPLFGWDGLLTNHSNRRLDNHFNIFEGLFKNLYFIVISALMCGGQVLIIFVGGAAFSIAPDRQTAAMWGYAIFLGFLSIPVGMIIRLVPDTLLERLVPDYLKRRSHANIPGVTVSDDEERYAYYPPALDDVRDELTFLKRVKGGRVNNLKFAMRHPRETFMPKKSPSHSREHSRSNSIQRLPQTPPREDSIGNHSPAPTPESRRRSKSTRSRSNSALGAATVMAGIVAGGVAAGWSPIDRRAGEPDFGVFPRSVPESTLGDQQLTEEPHDMEEAGPSNTQNVPILGVPKPPSGDRRPAP